LTKRAPRLPSNLRITRIPFALSLSKGPARPFDRLRANGVARTAMIYYEMQ